jgi:protein-tyrosine phosphatase
MKSLIAKAGMEERIAVDSAGTGNWHIGKLPDRRMREAASRRGIDLVSRAKQFTSGYFQERDLIVAMDEDNRRNILKLGHGAAGQVRLFSEFLDSGWPVDVPDPYYGECDGFEYVLDMLAAACPKILERLVARVDASS